MTNTKHTLESFEITCDILGAKYSPESTYEELDEKLDVYRSAPELLGALMSAANTFYALRDHAQAEGLAGTVEQKAIDSIIATIAKARGE